MVLYELVNLGLNSWNFYLGLVIRSSKSPIQVLWSCFELDSMLTFEVLCNGEVV